MLHPDRLLPSDPGERAIARRLYDERARSADRLAARPYRSALVRREQAVRRIRRSCSSRPTITSTACSTARAWSWRSSACAASTAVRSRATREKSGAVSPSTIISSAARRRAVARSRLRDAVRADRAPERRQRRRALRSRSTRLWRRRHLRRARCSSASTSRRSRRPKSPLDELEWRRMIRDSGWKGRVVTAYRPDAVGRSGLRRLPRQRAPARRADGRGRDELARLSRGAPQAPRLLQELRRDLDRPRPSERAHRRPRR